MTTRNRYYIPTVHFIPGTTVRTQVQFWRVRGGKIAVRFLDGTGFGHDPVNGYANMKELLAGESIREVGEEEALVFNGVPPIG